MITIREEKGSALTHEEVDVNFKHLRTFLIMSKFLDLETMSLHLTDQAIKLDLDFSTITDDGKILASKLFNSGEADNLYYIEVNSGEYISISNIDGYNSIYLTTDGKTFLHNFADVNVPLTVGGNTTNMFFTYPDYAGFDYKTITEPYRIYFRPSAGGYYFLKNV